MRQTRRDGFRKDALRIALSSKDQNLIQWIKFPEHGLTLKRIASDLGVGMSTLTMVMHGHLRRNIYCLRRCSSSLGMISTKLQGLWR